MRLTQGHDRPPPPNLAGPIGRVVSLQLAGDTSTQALPPTAGKSSCGGSDGPSAGLHHSGPSTGSCGDPGPAPTQHAAYKDTGDGLISVLQKQAVLRNHLSGLEMKFRPQGHGWKTLTSPEVHRAYCKLAPWCPRLQTCLKVKWLLRYYSEMLHGHLFQFRHALLCLLVDLRI